MPNAVQGIVSRMLDPIRRRVSSMVCRGVIALIDDSKKMQLVQVGSVADRVHDRVERFQEYGFTSHPPKGSEAVCLAVGGDQGHYVVVATDDRATRPTAYTEGDVGLYDSEGTKVKLVPGFVELGLSPAEFAARDDHLQTELARLKTELDGYKTVFDAHIHITTATVGVGPPGVIAATTTPFTAPATPGATACDEVKAK